MLGFAIQLVLFYRNTITKGEREGEGEGRGEGGWFIQILALTASCGEWGLGTRNGQQVSKGEAS